MTQPKIEGVGHGVPRMVYASDGSHWYAIKVRDSGIVEVCSKSGDKIFGFESVVEEEVKNENLSPATNVLSGTAVPAGKIWKITQTSVMYVGTVTGVYMEVGAIGLAGDLYLLRVSPVISSAWYSWSGEIYMQAGDYLATVIYGATTGDDAYLRYAGVQMNAP